MKKVLSLLLAVIMTVSCFSLIFSVSAAEAGTLPSNAIQLTSGKYYYKYWTKDNYRLNCYNKITIGSRGYITLTLEKPYDDEGEICSYKLYLVDGNGDDVWNCNTAAQTDSFSEYYTYKVGLNKGTYYLNIKPNFYVYSGSIPGSYKYDFTSSSSWEVEPNNTLPTATSIELNKMYSGVYADESYSSTCIDYYKVKLTKGSNYELKVDNYQALDAGTLILRLVDPSGEEKSLYDEKMSGNVTVFKLKPTVSGTYYIQFDNDGNEAGTSYKVGVYYTQLSLSKCKSAKLSATSYVYDGKAKKPTATLTDENGRKLKADTDYTIKYSNNTKIGKATATITGKGNYKGTKTLSFTIKPAKVTGLKATSKTTSISLTWTAVKGATSYVVYSYSSGKYKKLTTVKTNKATIKDLKAGKEYSYAVEAVANSIAGSKSSVLQTAAKPGKPKITYANGSEGWIDLEWIFDSKVRDYEIFIATSKDGKYKKVETTYSDRTTIFDVKPNKTYYVKIRSYIEYGESNKKLYSDFSAVKTVKVRY